MIIDKSQLAGHEPEIATLKTQLLSCENEIGRKPFITAADLLGEGLVDWEAVKWGFRNDFRLFDPTLFRLHLQRKASLQAAVLDNILTFLTIGYLYTRDVRYFNEFLFFQERAPRSTKYYHLMLQLFFDNLNARHQHVFPLCDRKEMEAYLREAQKTIEHTRSKPLSTAFRLALLGHPAFFKKIYAHFLARGFDIRAYFIPVVANGRINLLQNRWIFWLLCLLRGVDFNFSRLDFSRRDPQISEVLKADKLDVGFQKLGFILRENLFESFKIGVINDHWAVLPYIRGRSGLEFSLLFGFPLVATAHVVKEDINGGDIVGFYRYDQLADQYTTLRQIRRHLRRESPYRAIDSMELLSRAKKPLLPNPVDKGLMFYSIHPALERFIEKHLLQ